MIKTGQRGAVARESKSTSIVNVAYHNHAFPNLGIESFTLSELVRRMPASHFKRPHRLDFHHLMLVVAGEGTHQVDLEWCDCRPGTAVHVRPGQVHHFGLENDLEAQVVVFTPAFLLPEPRSSGIGSLGALSDVMSVRAAVPLAPPGFERVRASFAGIENEYHATDTSWLSQRTLRHQLHALLLQLVQFSEPYNAPKDCKGYQRVNERFIGELERSFAATRQVEDYAFRLGYSTKTLERACRAVSGISPKERIERRVALEAKRLLANTDMPIYEIGLSIGFSEATNFAKFFRRCERVSPSQFRAMAYRKLS